MQEALMKENIIDEMKSRRKLNAIKKNLFVYSFLIIPLLNIAVFYFYVNINSILMAFQTPTGMGRLYYFSEMFKLFSYGGKMAICLKNTLLFFGLSTLILFPQGIIVSYFLFKKIRLYKFFRIMLFFPGLISSTVFVTLYKEMLMPGGPMTLIIDKLFNTNLMTQKSVLEQSSTAVWFIMLYVWWTGFGGNFLIIEGTMARIPDEVLEYARLDGVSPFKELVAIILPMIFPTISTLMLLQFTGVFTSSGPILVFYNNGDTYSTDTISFYIYTLTAGSSAGNYGQATAIGLFFTLLGLPIVFGVRWLTNKLDSKVEY